MVESEGTAMGIAMEPTQIAGIYESASRRKRIKNARVDHTLSASCFSSARLEISCDCWYWARYLLLTKIESRLIVPVLMTIQAIWTPKFKPTEKEKGNCQYRKIPREG